jgi:tetratricopeptide (TPR) repeat protein
VLYGAISANATLSRRHQGHALLLLGDTDALNRALACLRYVLDFETARNDDAEWRGSGQTHLLLARAYLALGDNASALCHARHAHRLLVADAPGGTPCRDAAILLHKLGDMCQ